MPALDPNRCAHVTWTVGQGGAKENVAIAEIGPLPPVWLPFWKGKPSDVFDLGPRGHRGEGYWPIVDESPAFDPATHTLSEPTWTPDVPNMTAVATYDVLALPPPPPPPDLPPRGEILARIRADLDLLANLDNGG